MLKAIIFDFFDVIRTDAYKTWLDKHGYKREGEFLDAVQQADQGEIDVQEFLALLSKITGQLPDAIFAEMEEDAKVDHQILALIARLRSKYQIGLLSNAPSAFLRNLLQVHDMEKYFDEIIISSEVGHIKPNPEVFHHILTKMNLEPQEAIFIDDNPKNIAGGERVGIRGILYSDAMQLEHDLGKQGIIT